MRRKSWTLKMTDANARTRKRAIGEPVPSGREIIERVTTATGEWQLQRRDSHFEIICNGLFLMASYNRESDRELAQLALERVSGDNLRVLVGGLGIGFTAQAALEDHRVAALDVVELEPIVVGWHRTFFADLCGRPLDDPRVRLIQGDLFNVPLDPGDYDALLLDTDNGPEWLARDVNQRIYEPSTVRRFFEALRPGGVVAFWSAERAPNFARVLREIASEVEEIEVPEMIAPERQGSAWIYLATRV
jgi:spermidine synthase